MNKLVVDAGKLIKFKRKVKGYSTQELAKILDVSPGLINNIENAKNDTFNIDLIYKLSSALDINVSEIISDNFDSILDSFLEINELSSSLKVNLKPLIKALINISNNENLSNEDLNTILEKLVDDINFYNTLFSYK